jgi:hypothetical protein
MAALIEEEGLDEDGLPMKRRNLHRQQKRKRKHKQVKKVSQDDTEDDNEDGDFLDSSSGQSGDESSSEDKSDVSDIRIISNDEVRSRCIYLLYSILTQFSTQIADLLPSKTAPSTKRTKSTMHAKKKRCTATINELENKDPPHPQKASARDDTTSPDHSAATGTTTSNMGRMKKV